MKGEHIKEPKDDTIRHLRKVLELHSLKINVEVVEEVESID